MDTTHIVGYQEAKVDSKDGHQRYLYLRTLEKTKPGFVDDLNYCDDGIAGGIVFRFYLKQLFDSGAIGSLYYEALSGSLQDKRLRFLTVTAPSQYGRKTPQKIFIMSKAFDDLTEKEFLSGLCDHEYVHAKDGCLGIPVEEGVIDHSNLFQLQSNTFRSVKEIRAHLNELEGLVKDNMQDTRVYSNALHGVTLYGQQLLEIQPANDFEDKVRKVYLNMLRERLTSVIG